MKKIAIGNHETRASSVFHVRSAQCGDICILLEPTDGAEIAQLRHRQHALQVLFGGTPVEPVHLTCQRFEVRDGAQLDQFIRDFAVCLTRVMPFSFTALALQTLYVPNLQSNVLKWQVQRTDTLRRFVNLVNRELAGADLFSLYAPGAVASLVTALKGVPALTPVDFAQVSGFPHHLFTTNRVVLSRIRGPDKFEILATFELT
jgi:hypothetical protein